MTSRFRRALQLALTLFLAGCSSLAPLLSPPTPVPPPQATATPQATLTLPAPTEDLPQPRLLRVWLPPRFDPHAGTPSASLLKARLEAFEANHPGLKLDIRIKSEADILRILSLTESAATAAMPDLVALSYWNLQEAASAGFLHPLEGLSTILQDADWYAFARELGHHKNIQYGVPFASDVLVLVYRPAVFEAPPASWEEMFTSGAVLTFPASDPKAFFPLSLYLSSASTPVDEQGTLTLDEARLIRVFEFYRRALQSGNISLSTRNNETDSQTLQLYRSGLADAAVVWSSSDILDSSGGYAPLPGLEGGHYALGDGWVWALAGAASENQPLAVELAAYLVESSFMAEWTRAAGFLPTRPQALNGWEDEALHTSLGEALQSAYPLPPQDVVEVVGPLLQGGVIRIFNGESPESVARSVIESLK